jgi:hypothetical protein
MVLLLALLVQLDLQEQLALLDQALVLQVLQDQEEQDLQDLLLQSQDLLALQVQMELMVLLVQQVLQ